MPKITLQTGDISRFSGDAIVVHSDIELTNTHTNRSIEKILEKGGPDLIREASAIGYCEIGNVVRTNGYNLKVQHVIFLPYTDNNNPENTIDFVLLHQSLRAVFTMATLYNVGTLAIPLFRPKWKRKSFKEKLLHLDILDILFDNTYEETFREIEIEDIIMGVSPEFDKQSLQEVVVYKRFM